MKLVFLIVIGCLTAVFCTPQATGQANWERLDGVGGPVIDLGASGTWDDYNFYGCTVIVVGSNYSMWYSGSDGTNTRIGLAYSPNGSSWTKWQTNPVMNLGASGSLDDYHVYDPDVMRVGGEYYMWFTGNDGSRIRVGFARSADIYLRIVPESLNIRVGPTGGTIDYTVFVNNCRDTLVVGDLWTLYRDPNDQLIGPILNLHGDVAGGESREFNWTDNIPSSFDPGLYQLICNIGSYSSAPVATVSFPFIKEYHL